MKKITFLLFSMLLSVFSWQGMAQDYCVPEGTNASRYIDSFTTTGGLDNVNITNSESGFSPGGYGDFTDLTVEQGYGGVIEFDVTIEGGTAGFRIWVDWNQDGVFDPENEVVYHSESYGSTHSGSFNIPADALVGSTTMRIVSHWLNASGLIDPCATNFEYGEFEDYTIDVSSQSFWDCEDLEANIGDACDDGDPTTTNDTVNEDCECEGEATIPGEICENPLVIDELPFTATDNTENFGNHYSSSDRPDLAEGAIGNPSSSYLSGDDVVYSYTPEADEILNISVTEHGSWAGVFVFTGCPFESTVGGHTSSSATTDLEVIGLPVEADETYYIVISTWAAPQSTPYTLNITKLSSCDEASAGVPDEAALMVCAGAEFTIGVTGATEPASGLERVWQSSPAGDNDWTEIANSSSESLTVEDGVLEATDYRYVVTCTPSDDTDESDIIQITINPDVTECYCESSGSSVEPITYVGFGDIDNTTDASSSDGYEDFTGQSTEVDPGETYEITLKGNTSGNFTNHFTVFIDWNQNGVLDDDGEIYEVGSVRNSSGTDDISVIGDIVVPVDAVSGDTRMRIVKNFNSSRTTPCGSFTYGQVEDYTVTVTGDTGGDFPSPYCNIADADDVTVEEITKVVFDDTTITNDDTESALINKTDTAVSVMQGETYTISVEGNTNGDFDTNIVAFIDWNQNGVLDDEGEIFEIGTLTNSDGNDGTAVTMDITVPMDAVEGPTRIRLTKTYTDEEGDSPMPPSPAIINPCAIEFDAFEMGAQTGYGQALDFTLEIEETDDTSFACSFAHEVDGDANGGAGSSVDSAFKSAVDISVAAGQNFTLETILVPFLTYAPEDAPITAQVVYYENAEGLPGTEIGSETVVPTILSAGEWVNPIAYEFETQLEMTPFTFDGSYDVDTTYWIEISMGTATNQETVFWAYTEGEGIEGIPMAQFNGDEATWSIPEAAREGIYNFSGECSFMESLGDCTGTPDAGIAMVSPESGNVSIEYIVSASGFSAGYTGLTYQWQSNTDGDGWVDEGDTETHYSVFTATAPDEIGIEVEWRLAVTCTFSEETSYSDTATFTSILDYCDATSSTVEPITRVVFAGIDNASSPTSTDPYEDFTAIEGQVEAGETYSFAAEGNTGGSWTNYFTVWIDWNQNGEFEPNEMYEIGSITESTGTDGQQAISDITVPSNAVQGNTRMRVRKNFNSPFTNPCGQNSYGQTEDYTITVGEMDDCEGIPDAGVAMVDPEEGTINSSYTVSATGYSIGNGMTYQWQSNTDGDGWEDEGDLMDAYSSHDATAPAESDIAVEWRLEVTCTLSEETSYSETATFTTTEASPYCIPVLDCTDGDMITNVTFQEIDNTTTCSPDGYGDYTDMVATVQPGSDYPISVTVGDGWTHESVSVWIDFNNNGVFEEDEFFYIGTGSDETLTANIHIPSNATDGSYRMRVRVAAVGEDTATWDMACDETQGFGETEDYTVTVTLSVDDHAISDFKYYPNPMTDSLYITADENIDSVSVYNILGQQVLSNEYFNNGKVDASTLSTGTYIFRVTFDNGHIENFKVVKK